MSQRQELTIGPFNFHYSDSAPDILDKPVLITLHGIIQNHMVFTPLVEKLGSKARIIALDLPGFGASRCHEEFSEAALFSALERFLYRLGLSRVGLMGHSLGGVLALRFAAQYPKLVRGLVVLNAPLSNKDIQPALLGLLRLFSRKEMVDLINPRKSEPLVETVVNLSMSIPDIKFGDFTRRELVGIFLREMDLYFTSSYCSYLARIDLSETLKDVKCPTLALYGSKDRQVLPGAAERFRELMPRAKVLLYPDADHHSFFGEAQLLSELLPEFCYNSK